MGADTLPVPGNEWQELQSVLPDAFVNVLWSCPAYAAPGLSFMWQLLQRPVVPLITSALAAAVKFAWKRA